MFDFLFPKDWSTLKKLIWLKASVLIGAVYSTFTGSIARFLSPSSKPVKSIVCNIEPVQSGSGDPSPDNVRPISGFTGLNVYGESEYDPTADPKVAVTWQSEAGTVYAGYLSIDEDGNVTLTAEWVGATYTSVTGKSTYSAYCYSPSAVAISKEPNQIAASYLKTFDGNTNTATMPDFSCTNVGGAGTIFGIRLSDDYATKEDYDTYLAANPLTVIVKLATPVTYTLTSVTVPSTVQGENNWWHDANGNITIEAIGTPISSDEPDALQSLNILLGGAYTPRANFSEPTDEQALNIIMGGQR